jgi:hypothetical protein
MPTSGRASRPRAIFNGSNGKGNLLIPKSFGVVLGNESDQLEAAVIQLLGNVGKGRFSGIDAAAVGDDLGALANQLE